MKFLQNIHAIRDLVGLYGVTKIDKSEQKVSRKWAESEQKVGISQTLKNANRCYRWWRGKDL